MPTMMENVKTVNSSVRTVLMIGILGVVGFCGYTGYNAYIKPGMEANQAKAQLEETEKKLADEQAARAAAEQTAAAAEQKAAVVQAKNDRLETSMKLLKIDRRMANIEVLQKSKNEKGEPTLLVRYTEVDELGNPVGSSRDFTLRGQQIYIDCWLVQFEDKYIEQQDLLRSASLCVFKSIYGEIDAPLGAYPLDDQTDHQPGVYKDDAQNAFEAKIWSDFWNLSNDPSLQRELGIRASHGQANHIEAQEGKVYQVMIRSSGAVSLKPIDIRKD